MMTTKQWVFLTQVLLVITNVIQALTWFSKGKIGGIAVSGVLVIVSITCLILLRDCWRENRNNENRTN